MNQKVEYTGELLTSHAAAGASLPPSSTQARGVQAIALFEAAKAALVLVVGCGLLAFLHRDLQAAAERLVRLSHLNPARHYPRIFLDAVARIDDKHLVMLAVAACLYATLRFIEAYGLWRARAWAQWLAIVSGSVYLPLEIYEFAACPGFLRAVVLTVNAAIVAYLLYFRRIKKKHLT